LRDALPNLVFFAVWRICANSVERDLHIGQCAAIEASINHTASRKIFKAPEGIVANRKQASQAFLLWAACG
jgi:hypothetical protein